MGDISQQGRSASRGQLSRIVSRVWPFELCTASRRNRRHHQHKVSDVAGCIQIFRNQQSSNACDSLVLPGLSSVVCMVWLHVAFVGNFGGRCRASGLPSQQMAFHSTTPTASTVLECCDRFVRSNIGIALQSLERSQCLASHSNSRLVGDGYGRLRPSAISLNYAEVKPARC